MLTIIIETKGTTMMTKRTIIVETTATKLTTIGETMTMLIDEVG